MTRPLKDITTPRADISQALLGGPELRAQCLEMLAEKYREPIFLFIQTALGVHESHRVDDLVQGFFLEKFMRDGEGKTIVDTFDQEIGKFRYLLMAAVRNYVSKQREKGNRDKSYSPFAKVHPGPQGDNIPDKTCGTPEDKFNWGFMKKNINDALEIFRLKCLDHGKKDYYDVFLRHVFEQEAFGNPSYEETAKELGITVKRVENCRANAIKNFQKTLLKVIRTTVSHDSQVEEEIADLKKYAYR